MLVGPKDLQAPRQPSQMATPTEFEAVHYAPPRNSYDCGTEPAPVQTDPRESTDTTN